LNIETNDSQTKSDRTMKILPTILGLLVLVWVALAQPEVQILNIIVGASHLPVWLAAEHELFEKHGVHARVRVVDSAELERRLGGDVPFGVVGAAAAISATASGRGMKILMPLNNARTTSQLVARTGISTAAELKGKRVAVARIGTGF
jgi:ABC-type nitrate/sulfonate/bicarbonate transport system substrate-binding protein